MDKIQEIMEQANLKRYNLDYATLPHEDLMACIDLLYDEHLLPEGSSHHLLNWRLIATKSV